MTPLTPERWRQIQTVFDAALQCQAAEREKYLEEACAGDQWLRSKVDKLLAHDQRVSYDGFLKTPNYLHRPALGREDEIGPTSRGTAESAVRYQPLRLHARGGFGEVYVARDEQFDREVALKRIQEQYNNNPETRQRFLVEAEITAQLEHPGIVPVLSLAQSGDGLPCYAMRFVQGETLDAAIGRFHNPEESGLNPGERRLAFRQLLSHFRAVCNTVAYAHSRGIVHRDIKPHNILLGKYGEAFLVDWGLAKRIGRPESAPTGAEDAAAASPSPGYSRPGSPLGTPAYMSPEQAAGNWDKVGTASDIYSLGATLYALLTGRSPFPMEVTDEMVSWVKRGEFLRPRQREKNTPPALEAICLKAMARQPEKRYPTALALAEELEHWLGDEPVSAYRESLWAQTTRWSRRHKVVVASVGAGLAAAVVFLALLAGVVDQARRRSLAEQARTEEARQRTRAALDEVGSAAIDTLLVQQKEFTPEHKAFLRKMLTLYQEFAEQADATPSVQSEVANAYFRMGHIRYKLGEFTEAEAAYRTARELYFNLVENFPTVREYRAALAKSYLDLAKLLRETGRPKNAEELYRMAHTLCQELVEDEPGAPEHRADSARSLHNLGEVLRETGRPKEAEQAWRTANGLFRELAEHFPAVPQRRADLAASHDALAILFRQTGRLKEAEQAWRDAVALFQKLSGDFPTVPRHREALAHCLNHISTLSHDTGHLKDAEQARRDAVAILQKLTDDFPAVPDYRDALAQSLNSLGGFLSETGRPIEAEQACHAATATLQRLADDFPAVPRHRESLARSSHNLSLILYRADRQKEAEQACRNAVALQQKLAEDFPRVPNHRECLAHGYTLLSDILREIGQLKEAEQACRAALAIRQKLTEDLPAAPEHRANLAASLATLGLILNELGRLQEAEPAYCQAIVILEELIAKFPNVGGYAVMLGGSYGRFGTLMSDTGKPEASLDCFTKAIRTLQAVLDRDARLVMARAFLRESYRGRAEVLTRLEHYEDALQDWDHALALAEGPIRAPLLVRRAYTLVRCGQHARGVAEVDDLTQALHFNHDYKTLFDSACVCALASAAGKDEPELARTYAARAIALLRRLERAGGFKEVAQVAALKKDTALDPLRSHEDFIYLVRDVERIPIPEAK